MDVDVVILGLGPGGELVANKLARSGLKVVGVERRLVGGECPYYGCVPSKMMIQAAGSLAAARRVSELGGRASVEPDWSMVAERIRTEATDDWDDRRAVERLEHAGVSIVRGHGRLVGPRRVEVDGTTYDAARGVVINTGTDPAMPTIDGLAGTPYWTNRDVARLTELPASLVVVGGGAIGAEFAQAFARFGVPVTLVERSARLLPTEEPEAGRVLAEAFALSGIRLVTGASIRSVSSSDGAFTVKTSDRTITGERLLVAAGRRNNLADIGLARVGLDPDAEVVETDERLRAGPGLWALGDITGKGAFTHVSMYQGRVVVRDLLGVDGPWADYRAVSRVTFTDPEVASVGLTEKQAVDAGIPVTVSLVNDLGARGWLAKASGLVKLVADSERGFLVGATVVGPSGGEVLALLAGAVQAEIPIATLANMHFAYPTYHRVLETALRHLLA